MIYFLAPRGLCGIENYIYGRWRESNEPEIQCVAYEDVFMQQAVPGGTWIFVGAEQLPAIGKILAEAVWQSLTDAGQIVINRPQLLPSRHVLLDRMYRAGINEFRSYLPREICEEVRYPVFVRQAEQHTGSMSGLIGSRKQLEAFLRWQRLRGYKLDELLVIEFCDTANALGEYRKYSAQYVRGEVSARYLHVDTHWMVKAHGSTFNDQWAHEECEFIRENSHAAEIKNVFDLAKIEYGRIDYGLLDGRVQVWEINTNPTIGGPPPRSNVARTPPEIRSLLKPGKKIYFERFHSMLEAIDSPYEPGLDVELSLPAADVQAWQEAVKETQRLHQRRELLRRLSAWPPLQRASCIAKKALGV